MAQAHPGQRPFLGIRKKRQFPPRERLPPAIVGDTVPDHDVCDWHQLIHLHLPATVRVRGKKNIGKMMEGSTETRDGKRTTKRSVKKSQEDEEN